jgi:hypothetical protein
MTIDEIRLLWRASDTLWMCAKSPIEIKVAREFNDWLQAQNLPSARPLWTKEEKQKIMAKILLRTQI